MIFAFAKMRRTQKLSISRSCLKQKNLLPVIEVGVIDDVVIVDETTTEMDGSINTEDISMKSIVFCSLMLLVW